MSKNDLFMISAEDYEGTNSKVQTIKNNSIDKTFTITEDIKLILSTEGGPLIFGDNIIWHNNDLYIGGVTTEDKPYVGKLKSDNTFEALTTPFETGYIYTMMSHDNTLYIGGRKSGAKSYVGKLKSDNTTFEDISPFDNIGWINTMISHDNNLYVGGVNNSKPYVGKLSDNSFDEITTFSEDGWIYTMTSHNNDLYIGGVNKDTDKPYVGKLSDNSFDEITTFSEDGYILTMISHNNDLYIGGFSGSWHLVGKSYVGKLSDNSFDEITTFSEDGYIHTMTSHDNSLYIGGKMNIEDAWKKYVGKLKSDNTTFETIIGTGDGEYGTVGALYSRPKDEVVPADDKKKDDNLALILGLTLGLGLPIIIAIIYYIRMRK